jgi:hypothetical protein
MLDGWWDRMTKHWKFHWYMWATWDDFEHSRMTATAADMMLAWHDIEQRLRAKATCQQYCTALVLGFSLCFLLAGWLVGGFCAVGRQSMPTLSNKIQINNNMHADVELSWQLQSFVDGCSMDAEGQLPVAASLRVESADVHLSLDPPSVAADAPFVVDPPCQVRRTFVLPPVQLVCANASLVSVES